MTVPNLFDSLSQYRKEIDRAQENYQNQATASTNTSRNPIWVSRYPIGDVSYPDFQNSKVAVFATTGAASAGTAHTHDVTGNSGPSIWNVDNNRQRGAIITISNTALLDCYATYGQILSGSGINNVYLDLYRIEPSGGAVRIYTEDISARVSGATDYLEVLMPSPIACIAGEQFMVVLRNQCTNTMSIGMIGVTSVNGQTDSGASWASPDVGLSTYTSTQMADGLSNTAVQPWAQLASKTSTSIGVVDQSYSDNFDRSAIGGLWTLKSNTPGFQLKITNGALDFSAIANAHQEGIYISRTNGIGTKCEVGINFNSWFANSGQRCGPMIHCARDFSQMVFLGVGKTAVNIYSGSYTSLTSRATISYEQPNGLWGITYIEATDTYTALKDGNEIGLTWPSAGSAVTHGINYQFGGARIEYKDLATSGTIDNWTLRDWKP